MIKVVFDGVGVDASDKAVQNSIANLVKRKLEKSVNCACKQSHVVLVVGGAWRTGDDTVNEVSACCMDALAGANKTLLAPASQQPMPSGFARSALSRGQGAAEASGLFTLR